jgi:hypothetical protein
MVIEAFVPDSGAPRSAIELRTIGAAGVVLTVTRVAASDAVVRGEHVEVDEHGVRSRPWVIRLAWPEELDAMADAAGLRLVERWAGWDGEPYEDGDPVHVSLYGAR